MTQKSMTAVEYFGLEEPIARFQKTVKGPKQYRLLGLAGVFAFMSIYSYGQAKEGQKQIAFRKSQLAKPVIKLAPKDLVNPPWCGQNLKDWMYRRVEVTGRPIHKRACLIPNSLSKVDGFEYVLPLVVEEDQNLQHRKGILLSQGWLSFLNNQPPARGRRENATQQTFLGYVSKLSELSKPSSFFGGNARQYGRLRYQHADLEDIAFSSGLENPKEAQVAVVEVLHETGVLDERLTNRYHVGSLQQTERFPYAKTESGALQLAKMPWDYQREAYQYGLAGIASFVAMFIL